MKKQTIYTAQAPKAIGTYSQAVKADNTIYLSGQIALDPDTMELVTQNIEMEIKQVFKNLSAVCEAAGGSLQDIVKLTIYLTNLSHFASVNDIMSQLFKEPYPARATIGVAQLPKDVNVEIDGIMST